MADNIPPVYPSATPTPHMESVPPPPPIRVTKPAGRGWKVFAILLLFLVVLLIAKDVVAFMFLARGGSAMQGGEGQALMESVVEDNGAAQKIALVDVDGIIMSGIGDSGHDMVVLIKEQLKQAAADRSVKAVLLKVDSPGGEVMASDAISAAIRDFQTNSGKPVICSMGGMAASGGYYVSAPCRWIVAHELTMTGSIGVIMHGYNFRQLMDKIGVRPEVYKSGKFKDMLSWDKSDAEITKEERDMIQALINQTYERFKDVVAQGRGAAADINKGKGRKLEKGWELYADGRILTGKDAFSYGFIDELGGFEDAVKRAKSIAGISNANLVRYEPPFNLSRLLRWLVKTEPPAVKVDLGIDVPRLQAGRLYFIAPSLWH